MFAVFSFSNPTTFPSFSSPTVTFTLTVHHHHPTLTSTSGYLLTEMDKQPNKRLTWLPSVAQRKKRREEQGLPSTSSSSDDTHKSIRHRLQAVYRRTKALRAIFQPRPLPSRPRSEVLLQGSSFPESPPQLPHLSLSSARLPSFPSSWSLSELPPPLPQQLPPPVPQRPPPPPPQQRCFQLPPLRPQRLPTRLPPCPGSPPTGPLPLIPVAGRPVLESGFLYADLRRRLEIYAWVDRVPAWQYW